MKSYRNAVIATLVFAIGGYAEDAKPAAKTKLATLAWLTGHWKSPADEQPPSEEIWSQPANGSMIGMFRQAVPGKNLYEFLLIEEDDKGITKRFKHFRAGYAEVEKEPLTLRVTELTDKKVVFTAATEGKLKSIVYELASADRLHVTVNTSRSEKPFKIEIDMDRAKAK